MNRSIGIGLFLCWLLLPAKSGAAEPDVIMELKSEIDRGDPKDNIEIYNDLAWEYHFSDFDSSMKYTNLALELAERFDEPYWRAVSLEMKAILFEISGQVREALNLYFEVIPLRESFGGVGLENTYNNMAVIFRNQGNYENALFYFRQSYEIEKRNNNRLGIAESLNNIALSQSSLGQRDSVEALLFTAKHISDSLGNQNLTSDISLNLADFYLKEDNIPMARLYYEEVYKLAEENRLEARLCPAALGLAEIHLAQGDLYEAKYFMAKARESVLKTRFLEYRLRIENLSSEIFAAEGNYEAAWRSKSEYLSLKDSVARKELVTLSNTLAAQFENERKERRIAELQRDTAEQKFTAEANRNQRNMLIFFAVALLGTGGVISYRYVVQRRVASLLTAKNQTIRETLDDREILLREIHHRVKNNLQIVSSLLSIQSREITDQKAIEAVNESKLRVGSMALIHQFLYSKENLKSIDMQQYITQLSQNLFAAYRTDRDKVALTVNAPQIYLDVDTAIPIGLIINELITNSLKYAFPNEREGMIRVLLWEEGDKLNLQVSDNGVGQSENAEQSGNFGMKLLKAFQKKLRAELIINFKNGTEIHYIIGKYARSWTPDSTSLL